MRTPNTAVFITLFLLQSLGCAWLAIGVSPAAANQPSETETRQQLKQVKKKIKNLQSSIKSTQRKRSKTEQALRKAELKISKTRQSLRLVSKKVNQSKRQINKLKQEQLELDRARMRQEKALIKDIQAAYRAGREEYLKLLLNQQSPEKLARVLKYYQYFHNTRIQHLETFSDTLKKLESNQQTLTAELNSMEQLKQRLATEKRQLGQAQLARKSVLHKLATRLKNKDMRLKQLNRNQRELQQLLNALQESLADLPANLGNHEEFNARKGKLPWPARGKILRSFRSPRQDSSLRWNGVLLQLANGTAVKTIHPGHVVFSDWLRGFGLITIIDHGSSYYSLYGHNESLLKEAGDWVEGGDIIAYSGASGGHNTSGLYFEIRHNNRPVNPRDWCQ